MLCPTRPRRRSRISLAFEHAPSSTERVRVRPERKRFAQPIPPSDRPRTNLAALPLARNNHWTDRRTHRAAGSGTKGARQESHRPPPRSVRRRICSPILAAVLCSVVRTPSFISLDKLILRRCSTAIGGQHTQQSAISSNCCSPLRVSRYLTRTLSGPCRTDCTSALYLGPGVPSCAGMRAGFTASYRPAGRPAPCLQYRHTPNAPMHQSRFAATPPYHDGPQSPG